MENFEDVEAQNDVSDDSDCQQAERDHGHEVDLLADALEFSNQLLLLEGVAVSRLADHSQLIFDTLEGNHLFDGLVAHLAALRLELGQAVFDGSEIDWRQGLGSRRPVVLRGEEVGVAGVDVSAQQGENPLHERQRGTERGHDPAALRRAWPPVETP